MAFPVNHEFDMVEIRFAATFKFFRYERCLDFQTEFEC